MGRPVHLRLIGIGVGLLLLGFWVCNRTAPHRARGRRGVACRETAPAVLDASALVAVLATEPGADTVEPLLRDALMSTVNWSEVLARYAELQLPTRDRGREVNALGVRLVAFSERHAEITAGLRPLTRPAGLSLGDRACLALALERGGRPVTADRAWRDLDLALEILVIR